MTYGCVLFARCKRTLHGAAVSHSAELVRGNFIIAQDEGPLIRPCGAPSPQGEKGPRGCSLRPLYSLEKAWAGLRSGLHGLAASPVASRWEACCTASMIFT